MTEMFPESGIRVGCGVHHTDGEGNAIPCPGYPHAEAPDTANACVHPEGYEGECPCVTGCGCCKVAPAHPRAKAEQPKPRASVIEIIGTGHEYTEDGGGSILLPKEVRINGVSVYTAKGSAVRISDIHVGEELVTVNLTLVARRVVIAADSDLGEAP